MKKLFFYKQLKLSLPLLVLSFWSFAQITPSSEGKGGNNSGGGLEYKVGVRFLSLQSFNEVLKTEGLAELNPAAFSCYFGNTIFNEKFVFNHGLHAFAAHGSENLNRSHFWGFGLSLDFGYQIWKNSRMCLYPYINASFSGNQFRTFQKTDANTIHSVYAQSLVERTFSRDGELDAALGLSYQIKISKNYLLRVGGGYYFRLWQNDWRHCSGNKVEFPKVDNRGWEIGISWTLLNRKTVKKEE